MEINTVRFGELSVPDELVFKLEEGLPGFPELKRYVLLHLEETEPFHWLQAIDDSSVALPVLNPFEVMPEYDPPIAESEFKELGINSGEEALLLVVAVIPEDVSKMTCNMLAPVLLNISNNKGKQVILETDKYSLRHSIFGKVKEILEAGGDGDAGADAQAEPVDTNR